MVKGRGEEHAHPALSEEDHRQRHSHRMPIDIRDMERMRILYVRHDKGLLVEFFFGLLLRFRPRRKTRQEQRNHHREYPFTH